MMVSLQKTTEAGGGAETAATEAAPAEELFS